MPEIINRHQVSKRLWKRWTPDAKQLFNDLFELMRDQRLFTHPKAEIVKDAHWTTTAWNSAWMAADLLTHEQRRKCSKD